MVFFHQLAMANGSEYYNTHEPQSQLLRRRSQSQGVNQSCCKIQNKTHRSCSFHPQLTQNPKGRSFKLQNLLAVFKKHLLLDRHYRMLSLGNRCFLPNCILGGVVFMYTGLYLDFLDKKNTYCMFCQCCPSNPLCNSISYLMMYVQYIYSLY